ncbi:glycoside hydrolase family 19 protein [Francisella marina]|uniref:Chitin-binding type-3 domain-containing protein n=1 Tax=Francisella marina TaxID=2249302 RepID=A0ABX5ZJY8_9GAMM|nr:glycoside hydrolase family 19 protein [Francisella marina]QEO57518.1 hypothetical protein F0R74_06510 [Francisella marina]QEO58363.1 hypothetical protein F0R75_00710 [Francisella marina]
MRSKKKILISSILAAIFCYVVPANSATTYQQGKSYTAGQIVVGTDGNQYQCKPFPASGWCGMSASHYAPGSGSHWQDAWTEISNANTSDNNQTPTDNTNTNTNNSNPGNSSSSNTSGSWQANKVFVGGDQVTYNGKAYKAKWWTKGDTPGSANVWELIESPNTDDSTNNNNTQDSVNNIDNQSWDSNKTYSQKGYVVEYKGILYENQWWTKGDTPGNTQVWKKIGPAPDSDDNSNNTEDTNNVVKAAVTVTGLGQNTETVIFTSIQDSTLVKSYEFKDGTNEINLPVGNYSIIDASPESSKLLKLDGEIVAVTKDAQITLAYENYTSDEDHSEVTNSELEKLLPFSDFEKAFPYATNGACTAKNNGLKGLYDGLIAAAANFPSFANPEAIPDRVAQSQQQKIELAKREIAAFLANVSQETNGGWATAPGGKYAWGLCFIEEVGCQNGGCSQYTDQSPRNPAHKGVPGQFYHGRGMIQLSWNYNYGLFQDFYNEKFAGNNPINLLANPGLVLRDYKIAWTSALWFWMTPQPPKPSAHDALLGIWRPSNDDLNANRVPGFGMTANIINGGIECNKGGNTESYQVSNRNNFYTRLADIIGTSTGDNLGCRNMRSY